MNSDEKKITLTVKKSRKRSNKKREELNLLFGSNSGTRRSWQSNNKKALFSPRRLETISNQITEKERKKNNQKLFSVLVVHHNVVTSMLIKIIIEMNETV